MTSTISPKARALLDAQVQFLLDQLTGDQLQTLLETELDATLANAETLTLNDVVTRDMIKATAINYAVDLDLSGAIPELVGDIGRLLYAHPAQQQTRLRDLLSDRTVHELVDKALELHPLREHLINGIVRSPAIATLATETLWHSLREHLAVSSRLGKLPGAQRLLDAGKAWFDKAVPPHIEHQVEDQLRHWLQRTVSVVLGESAELLQTGLDDDQLREAILGLWTEYRNRPLADIRPYVSEVDVEEFFVTGYDYWRQLRKTAYYRAVIETGIDGFFDKYGDTSLREILDEMGIDRAMMIREAMRFGPHVLDKLHRRDLVAPFLRRRLEGFYLSGAADAILVEETPSSSPQELPGEVT